MKIGLYNQLVKEEPIITTKYIYEKIDQIDIYYKYLNYYPTTNKSYHSPFSNDSNPSFRFKVGPDYKLTYKCFSTGRTGDAISLVQQLFNLNLKETLNKIAYDFKLQGTFSGKSKNISFQSSIKNANLTVTRRAEIQVVLFDSEPISYINYWKRFYIEKWLLDLYDVRAAKEAWFNGTYLYATYSDTDTLIRYLINGLYKTYRPFAKKEDKWRSTFDYRCLFGFKQLDYSSPICIISKSAKDVMVWRLLGYNAFTLPTEASRLWKELVEYLRSKFKYIFCVLDNDRAGISSMISYKEEWGIDYIILPELDDYYKDLAEINYGEGPVFTKALVNVLIKDKIITINNN